MEITMQITHKMKRVLCSCVAWLFISLAMQAQTCNLTMSEGSVSQGKEVTFPILLSNETDVSGGQFTVTLPQGITMKEVSLNEERSNGHTLEYRLNEKGNSVLILFYAQPTKAIKGNTGALCSLLLAADEDMEPGEYQVKFSDVRLAVDAIRVAEVTAVDGALTVTPRYTISATTVMGGSVEGSGIYDAGSMVTLTALPAEGYHFAKWSDGSVENPYTFEATSNISLVAEFAPNSYVLTYMVDGAEYKSVTFDYDATITVEAEPTKEGHTFSGWSEIPGTMPAKDVTVTGTFTANSYKVTYMLDGELFKTEDVVFGATIPTPSAPVKEGYNFSGWGEVPATMPAKDIVLNGSYTINKDNKYNVIYLVDGVEYKRMQYAFMDAIVAEAEPAKEGYTFSGWSEVPETMPLHDVTITGSFTANSYQLTYVLDGKTFQSESVVYGTAIVAPEVPAKEGYTFSGWTDVPATMPAKDVTIEGSYSINQYTLTYTVDGKEYKKVTLDYGTAIEAEAEPTKEGHTFSGWSEVPTSMPAKDVTITGTFAANSYKVTYMLDGELFKTEEVLFGTAIPTPNVPTKEGYNFSGWGEVPATMPAMDITLNGSYTINKDNKYNVIYYVDGVEYKRVAISFADPIEVEAAPTKEGYTFSGWSEVPESMPLHDVIVTGSFIANSYQLTYVLDGKTFQTESVTYGTAIVVPEVPIKEGYTFTGWTDVPKTMPAKDVTVTGSYAINQYTLTYMVDGMEYKKVTLDYGTAIEAAAEPTKEGHTFSGWNEVPTTMPAKDVTIEGMFSVNTYTLTYVVDGEVYATENVTYGSVIALMDAPTKEGYIFSGWSEIPDVMPAEDVTVTGTFEVDGINDVITNGLADVYTIQGVMVKQQIPIENLGKVLSAGIYIVNGRKFIVK